LINYKHLTRIYNTFKVAIVGMLSLIVERIEREVQKV